MFLFRVMVGSPCQVVLQLAQEAPGRVPAGKFEGLDGREDRRILGTCVVTARVACVRCAVPNAPV